ncbi:hypothetical protein [Streptomyces sp. NPDC056244]|uniref:hypothetical protein n=1 Tax=Streptomyces sp. NPDC056244 TaxID=3345762 RepID=UPI0035D86DAA
MEISHRVYDDAQLNGLRRQPSGVTDRKDLWEVRTDPYDVTRIWVRNHHHGGWITPFWKHLSTAPAPFGELDWNNSISELHDSGVTDPTEDEIAAVVGKLLRRAHDGPPGASTEKTPPRRRQRRPNALGRPVVLDTSASRARPRTRWPVPSAVARPWRPRPPCAAPVRNALPGTLGRRPPLLSRSAACGAG